MQSTKEIKRDIYITEEGVIKNKTHKYEWG